MPHTVGKYRNRRARRRIFKRNVEDQKKTARDFLFDQNKRNSFLNPIAIASMDYLVSRYTSNIIFVANPVCTKEGDTPCLYYKELWHIGANLEQEMSHSTTVYLFKIKHKRLVIATPYDDELFESSECSPCPILGNSLAKDKSKLYVILLISGQGNTTKSGLVWTADDRKLLNKCRPNFMPNNGTAHYGSREKYHPFGNTIKYSKATAEAPQSYGPFQAKYSTLDSAVLKPKMLKELEDCCMTLEYVATGIMAATTSLLMAMADVTKDIAEAHGMPDIAIPMLFDKDSWNGLATMFAHQGTTTAVHHTEPDSTYTIIGMPQEEDRRPGEDCLCFDFFIQPGMCLRINLEPKVSLLYNAWLLTHRQQSLCEGTNGLNISGYGNAKSLRHTRSTISRLIKSKSK